MQQTFINPLINEMKVNSAIRDRRIYLEGIVDEDTAFEVCYFLNRIRDIDRKNGTKNDIELIVNSFGGSIIFGNKILGLIENMKSEGYVIKALVTGMAFSMAFDIVCCCSIRRAYKYAQLLIHQTQLGEDYSSLIKLKRRVEFEERQWKQSVDYYLKYTNISKEKLDEIYNNDIDYFMFADEALSLNVIDEII